MKRLAVLGSTRGTNLSSLMTNTLNGRIEIVLSNKADAPILERARGFNLKAQFVDPTALSRVQFDEKISTILSDLNIDLIVLIGYMRILSPEFVTKWQHKIINVHPSLLPAFAGKMDLDVHKAVLAANVTETGCTVHYVTEVVDGGPIIVQKKCPVYANDTPETLKMRVQALEGPALVEAINLA